MESKKENYHDKYNSFYNSPEWKLLRNQKFVDSEGLCELCRKNGIISQGKEVHHIKPIEYYWELRLDYNNLILLCNDCHNAQHERISPLQEFLKEWDKI